LAGRGRACFLDRVRKLALIAAFVLPLSISAKAQPDAVRKTVNGSVAGGAVLAMGRSVGSPTAGHLVGGTRLPDASYLRIVPAYAAGEVRWGLGSLVGMIDRAAMRVRKAFPDSIMSVGHLSRHGGGEVDRHVSHESGRDADIGFYVRNLQGKPLLAEHFVAFRGDGSAPSWPGAAFDDARNWALVRSLLTDPEAHVTHIFVAMPLRARLLAYAAKSGAPPELRNRAALTMLQPHGALPHDDHFHVRISCPSWQRECVEVPIRKKPALVAKVPTPKSRVRAQQGTIADKPTTLPDENARSLEASRAGHNPPPRSETHGAPAESNGILKGAAAAVIPPAARLLDPLRKDPPEPARGVPGAIAPGDEAIDDVDGPM
jgi:penicillin-insensitive murein endopeptidase